MDEKEIYYSMVIHFFQDDPERRKDHTPIDEKGLRIPDLPWIPSEDENYLKIKDILNDSTSLSSSSTSFSLFIDFLISIDSNWRKIDSKSQRWIEIRKDRLIRCMLKSELPILTMDATSVTFSRSIMIFNSNGFEVGEVGSHDYFDLITKHNKGSNSYLKTQTMKKSVRIAEESKKSEHLAYEKSKPKRRLTKKITLKSVNLSHDDYSQDKNKVNTNSSSIKSSKSKSLK